MAQDLRIAGSGGIGELTINTNETRDSVELDTAGACQILVTDYRSNAEVFLQINDESAPKISTREVREFRGDVNKLFITHGTGFGSVKLLIVKRGFLLTPSSQSLSNLAIKLGAVTQYERDAEVVWTEEFEGATVGSLDEVTTFLGLTDTPSDYNDDKWSIPYANLEETALEFFAPDYGAGFNFLGVIDVAGVPTLGWVDIQALIIALTGALNRQIKEATLVVPAPDESSTATATSAGSSDVDEAPTVPVPSVTPSATQSSAGSDDVDSPLSVPEPTVSGSASVV